MVVNCGNARRDWAAVGLSTEQRPADPTSCRWIQPGVGQSDVARLFRLSRCTRPASVTCATEFVRGVGQPPPAAIPRAEGFHNSHGRGESVQPKTVWITSRNPGAFTYLAPAPASTAAALSRTGESAMIHPLGRPSRSAAISRAVFFIHPTRYPAVSAVSHYSPRFVRAQSIRHRPRPNGAQTRRFAGVARA